MNWKVIRLAILFIVVALEVRTGLTWAPTEIMNMSSSERTWSLVVLFFAAPLLLQLIVGFQAINPFSDKVWFKPTWESNPFSFKQPLVFFHFVGTVVVAQALVGIIFALFIGEMDIWPYLFVEVGGISTLLGVELSQILFRFKFSEKSI